MHNIFTPTSTRVLRKLAAFAAIPMAFAGAFWVNLRLRGYPFFPSANPLAWKEMTRFEIHQVDIGVFLQFIVVPVLLMFLLSSVPPFRRLLQDLSRPRATLKLFLAVLAVQLLSQVYAVWICTTMEMPFFIGLLVILIGSLLGGWRIGLSLGVISMVFQGTYELFTLSNFPADVQILGLWKFLRSLDVPLFLYANYFNSHISAGVWAAVFACMSGDLLGSNRFSPFAASILGILLPPAVGYLQLAAGVPPGLVGMPAQALVTGLAGAWVMLMMRNLQLETSRRDAAQAELARTQAELRALRAQINPHFFFNALNTIRYMIRTDPPKARALLIDLSEVFQRTLRSGDFVPLRDELGYVEAYLSLEKARLGDRLRVAWSGVLDLKKPLKTESPFLEQPVPTLALQPIVENAVIHGIGKKKEGGTVTISVGCQKDDLVIRIEDDGIGMDSSRKADLLRPEAGNNGGIGWKNVDSRLRLLYGPNYGLIVESEVEKGTRVTIRVPISEMDNKK
jgi:signal transduction histidine kinase